MKTILIATVILPAVAYANVHRVPSEYQSIQAAIDVSVNGDSVIVAPGRYVDNLNFGSKSIVVTSQFGALVTFLEPKDTTTHLAQFSGGSSELSGFSLSRAKPNHAVDIRNASPLILRNTFSNCGSPYAGGAVVYSGGISNFQLRQNVFWNNASTQVVVFVTDSCYPIITNNTIHSGRVGIALWSNAYLTGNCVTGCLTGISASKAITHNYNNSWGNTNYNYGFTPASGDISVDPEFVDTAHADFRLISSSPLIDAGDIAPVYQDPDGSRADIGAYPFNKNAAIAELRIDVASQAHVLSATPIIAWLSFALPGTQTAYEIEVGIDFDWSIAEMWDSGPVTSESNAVTYAGSPLVRGTTYCYRVRLLSGAMWGDWEDRVFTYNGLPTAPTPVSPVGGAITSIAGLKLTAANSTDANGDPLTYDYEVFSDASGTILVQSCYGIVEQATQTVSTFILGLDPDRDYWWKCRAHDGYELGDWSTLAHLRTRSPIAICVPADFPTIQQAIDPAFAGDTVLLAPGTYHGNGNRDLDLLGKSVVVKAEAGPGTATVDCDGTDTKSHRAFYLHSGEDTTAVIDGITITDAYGDAAVRCDGSGVTLRNCIVTQNHASGLYYSHNYPTMKAVVIDSCQIVNNDGAGVQMSDGRVSYSEFTNNSGNGLMMFDPNSARVNGCLFRGNPSIGLYYTTGGGPQPSFSNCTFVENNKGMVFDWMPPLEVTSGSIVTAGWISNCVFAFNDTGIANTFISPTMSCCNSYGNTTSNWPYGVQAGDSGNISLDPMFCDFATGNLRLMSSSPCAPANNSCGVLIGAFDIGCDCCEGTRGNVNMSGIVDLSDLSMLVGYLTGAIPRVSCYEEANVNAQDIVDLSDLSLLAAYLVGQFQSFPECP